MSAAPLWFEIPAPLSVASCEACGLTFGPFLTLASAFNACAEHSHAVHAGALIPRAEHERHMAGRRTPRKDVQAAPLWLCTVENCARPGESQGLCETHARRSRRAAA